MAWPLLCTYLRGMSGNWNPYSHIRMLPRQSVVHSYIVSGIAISGLSLCFSIELIPNQFSRHFR